MGCGSAKDGNDIRPVERGKTTYQDDSQRKKTGSFVFVIFRNLKKWLMIRMIGISMQGTLYRRLSRCGRTILFMRIP